MHLRRFLLIISFVVCRGIIAAQQIISSEFSNLQFCYNLENLAVDTYLEDSEKLYSEGVGRSGGSLLNGSGSSYYLSQIPQGSLPYWCEQPKTVRINALGAQSVILSDSPLFANSISFPVISGFATVYNLIPQKVYWYRTLDSSARIIKQGLFKTTGHLRMIYSPNVRNIRDLGGWKCAGGRLAYGKIFRGANLDNTAPGTTDYNILVAREKIGTDIDLRHDHAVSSENGNTSSPLGLNYKWYEIMAYMSLMTNNWSYVSHASYGGYYKAVGDCIKYMVNNPTKGAFYFHCTAGADRTGTIVALIEALCGMSEEDIVKDWELTSFSGYDKFIDQQISTWNYKNSTGELIKEPAEMRRVFQYLYDEFGGKTGATLQEQVTAWFKKNVFKTTTDQAYMTKLRTMLVVPEIKSPLLVTQRYIDTPQDNPQYFISFEDTKSFKASDDSFIAVSNGKVVPSDMFSVTDYIDCSSYKYLLTNVVNTGVASFYDSTKSFVGSVGDFSLADETILLVDDYREFSIPSRAAYMRLNLPKNCDVSAVLSVESLR